MRRSLALSLMVAGCSGTADPPKQEPTPPAPDAGMNVATDAGSQSTPDAGFLADRDGGPPPPDAGFEPVTLGPCVAPNVIPPDPLEADQIVRLRNQGVIHMLDVDQDPATGDVYLVGTGGFFVVSTAGGMYRQVGALRNVWNGPGMSGAGRGADFAKIGILGGGLVGITNRDLGVSIIDVSNPSMPTLVRSIELEHAAGLTRAADTLIVLTHSGDVVTYDLADPRDPSAIRTLSILGNPWTIATRDDRAYVADNTNGLVVMNIADPTNPMVMATVPTLGGAQDLSIDGMTLALAVGGSGVELFDLGNPDLPARLSTVDYGAAVVAVSMANNRVWGATHEGVVVIDATLSFMPLPLAMEPTDEWAMNIHATETVGFVADWSRFIAMGFDSNAMAPAADPERSDLFFLDDPDPNGTPQVVELRIDNRGGVDLEITGASVPDQRFTYEVDRGAIAPGDTGFFTITFADDGNPVDTELCIATNDPDEPLQRINLKESANTNTNTGEAAPDFDLPSVDDDNVRYRLSDELGHPVVLVYFATW